jgi:hypothetical protein
VVWQLPLGHVQALAHFQLIASLAAIPSRTPPAVLPTLYLRKWFGKFHWDLSKQLHNQAGLQAQGPYFHGRRPARRVLLLSPSVDLSRTANHLEMKMIIQGLMQVGGLDPDPEVTPNTPYC